MTHDPARADDLAAWRRKGGQQRSNAARAARQLPADPLSVAELESYLGVVFKAVVTRKIEPGVGTAAASIARALLEIRKGVDFEERLAEVEETLKHQAGRR